MKRDDVGIAARSENSHVAGCGIFQVPHLRHKRGLAGDRGARTKVARAEVSHVRDLVLQTATTSRPSTTQTKSCKQVRYLTLSPLLRCLSFTYRISGNCATFLYYVFTWTWDGKAEVFLPYVSSHAALPPTCTQAATAIANIAASINKQSCSLCHESLMVYERKIHSHSSLRVMSRSDGTEAGVGSVSTCAIGKLS